MEICHFTAHAAEIDAEIQNQIMKLWSVFKPLLQQMEEGQDLGLPLCQQDTKSVTGMKGCAIPVLYFFCV